MSPSDARLARLAAGGRRILSLLPASRAGRIVFVLLLALGIFLRVAGLDWGVPPRANAPSFYHDEGHVLGYVQMPWAVFRSTFGEYEIVRPVFLWRVLGRPLFALGDRLGWNDPQTRVYEFAVLRSLPAFFGIAGLIGVYLLGRKLGGARVGLWALAFLTVMPGHWYYSQILKGDIIVATMFTFLLLVAIRIVERGDWAAYAWTGVLAGAGTALKPTVLVAAPVLAVAHLIRGWRSRRPSQVFGSWVLLGVGLAVVSFLALYPYPFLDFSRWRTLLLEPSQQFFTLRGPASPQTYVDLWAAYNQPPNVFMTMVYGRFLQVALLPAALVALAFGLWRWWRERSWGLLLTVLLGVLFYHSLTFTGALDERYILPIAPLVALFPALIAAGALPGRFQAAPLRLFGVLFGSVLFGATAAVTAATYPSFGISDPREEAVQWVTERVQPKTLVGQPVILSRWSLVFDTSRVELTPLIVGADQERRVARLASPPFVAVQREPWNYDHTFRYELEGVRESFQDLLHRYERVQTFGREPVILGTRVPRNLGAPVVDIYERKRDVKIKTLVNLLGARTVQLESAPQSAVVFPRVFTAAELEDATVMVALDLESVRAGLIRSGKPVRIGLLALWDGAEVPTSFSDLPESSMFWTKDSVWAWLSVLRSENLRERSTITLAFDHSLGDSWDVYDGFDGSLRPQTIGRRQFKTVRFGVVVLGREEEGAAFRVTEAVVGQRESS